MKKIIEISNLTKNYIVNKEVFTALNNVSLEVYEQDIYGIIGLSGAGKSTLVRCINLLEIPTQGKITFLDEVLFSKEDTNTKQYINPKLNKMRQKMGMIFQNFNLFEQRNVLKNVMFPLELAGIKGEEAKEKALSLLSIVGLADKVNAYPSQLSGGQKQRVAIAGALALNPNLLILDEATSMLDPKGKKDINSVIYEIKKNNPKMAILSITHHIDEALLADEIIVLNNGSVAKVGTPSEILYDEKLLKENSLLPPFVVEVKNALKDAGVKIDECFTMEELVSKL